jgi:hypothetical protein
VQEGPLVKMLERQRVQQATADSGGQILCSYETDQTVMLEDVPQDIVFKTLKVSCACVAVCVCVCVRARAQRRCVLKKEFVFAFSEFCLRCNREITSHTSSRVDGRLE